VAAEPRPKNLTQDHQFPAHKTSNSLDHFYGHVLVWTRQYDTYPRTGLPVWRFKKALVDRLLAEKAHLSAIGIQAHEPDKGKYWYSPEQLWATYNLLGASTGLPIHITEYFNVSDTSARIRGKYRSGHWNEKLQADAIEEFYRVTFGHPSIAAIYYFGLHCRRLPQCRQLIPKTLVFLPQLCD